MEGARILKKRKKVRTSFETAVRVSDVRAEDGGIKEPARRLLAPTKLELFGRILKHAFEERRPGTTARAIEYQNSFIPLPAIPSAVRRITLGIRGGSRHLLSP